MGSSQAVSAGTQDDHENFGFYERNFKGHIINGIICVLSFMIYIVFFICIILRIQKKGSIKIPMKLQIIGCFFSFLIGICSFIGPDNPKESSLADCIDFKDKELSNNQSYGEEPNLEKCFNSILALPSCEIEAALRASAMNGNSIVALLNTIYSILMYTRPDRLETHDLFYNYLLFIISGLFSVIIFIFYFFISHPKIGYFGYCKYTLKEPEVRVVVALTIIIWIISFVGQIYLIYLINKTQKNEETDPRLISLSHKMRKRALSCLVDYFLILVFGMGSYKHLVYTKSMLWLWELTATLIWPVHIILYCYIGNDLLEDLLKCLGIVQSEIPVLQEEKLGELEEKHEYDDEL